MPGNFEEISVLKWNPKIANNVSGMWVCCRLLPLFTSLMSSNKVPGESLLAEMPALIDHKRW